MAGDARATAERQLSQMVEYGRLDTCRRRYLLDYFGDTTPSAAAGECGNCDVCLAERQSVDATVVAQKMLSAVIRTGERFGIAYVNRVLLGSRGKRITELEHNKLSVFGIVQDYDGKGLRRIADGLIAKGLLARADGEYAVIKVTDAGREWLRSRQPLTLTLRVDEPASGSQRRQDRSGGGANANANANGNGNGNAAPDYDAGLFEQLRAVRRRLADAQGVPAFVVFGDATLRNLAAARPANRAAMLQVSGVGPAKLEQYGDDFLAAICEYGSENPYPATATVRKADFIEDGNLDEIRRSYPRAYEPWTNDEEQELERLYNAGQDVEEIAAALGRQLGAIRSRLNRIGSNSADEHTLSATQILTQELLQQGLSIAEIARERGFSQGTVMSHIQRIADVGDAPDLTHLLPPPERMMRIKAAIQAVDGDRLAPVKELLGDDYSYDEIRLVRIADRQRNAGCAGIE